MYCTYVYYIYTYIYMYCKSRYALLLLYYYLLLEDSILKSDTKPKSNLYDIGVVKIPRGYQACTDIMCSVEKYLFNAVSRSCSRTPFP